MNTTLAAELLPWLNLLLVPVLGYLIGIERRLTRLEAIREAELIARQNGQWTHRRSTDPQR
jgi:hypothetical protein